MSSSKWNVRRRIESSDVITNSVLFFMRPPGAHWYPLTSNQDT
jgi:hypothetical protein